MKVIFKFFVKLDVFFFLLFSLGRIWNWNMEGIEGVGGM